MEKTCSYSCSCCGCCFLCWVRQSGTCLPADNWRRKNQSWYLHLLFLSGLYRSNQHHSKTEFWLGHHWWRSGKGTDDWRQRCRNLDQRPHDGILQGIRCDSERLWCKGSGTECWTDQSGEKLHQLCLGQQRRNFWKERNCRIFRSGHFPLYL